MASHPRGGCCLAGGELMEQTPVCVPLFLGRGFQSICHCAFLRSSAWLEVG